MVNTPDASGSSITMENSDGQNSVNSPAARNKAPPLPPIGNGEKFLRVTALPASLGVGAIYFHQMSRDGVQDFYADRGKLEPLEKEVDNKFAQAAKHSTPAAVRKGVKEAINGHDKGVQEILEKNFKNSWHYFQANSPRNKLNILLSTGAAISISLGLIVTVLEPRNRSAIAGLFHKVNHSQDNEQQR